MKEGISNILFEEVQSRTSRQTVVFFRTLFLIVLIAQVVTRILQKGVTTAFCYFLITLLSILFVINLVLPSNLTTQVRSDGIYVRFPPFQPSFSKFLWTDISEVYVRNYNALSEYFGWGIRFSPNGTGYIVAGTTGIQIIFNNGNKVLITTQRPEEVNEILRKIGKL